MHKYYRIYVKNYTVFYVVIDDTMEVRRFMYTPLGTKISIKNKVREFSQMFANKSNTRSVLFALISVYSRMNSYNFIPKAVYSRRDIDKLV
ncbi:hypothetical protein AGMMS49944_13110 [Spirochaetia bacterium]|nr:hypothetical protein AGMMS49944_13110 [Spirochaetia bacterium]